jgi:hypothetical protein
LDLDRHRFRVPHFGSDHQLKMEQENDNKVLGDTAPNAGGPGFPLQSSAEDGERISAAIPIAGNEADFLDRIRVAKEYVEKYENHLSELRSELAAYSRKIPDGMIVEASLYPEWSHWRWLRCRVEGAFIKAGKETLKYVCVPINKDGRPTANRNKMYCPADGVRAVDGCDSDRSGNPRP